jgi:hypothetical protein
MVICGALQTLINYQRNPTEVRYLDTNKQLKTQHGKMKVESRMCGGVVFG